MLPSRSIRLASQEDDDAIAEVMYDAIRNGPSAYTPEQRASWMPEKRSGDVWSERLASQRVFLAEDTGRLLGFMSLAAGGYIDLAYIRPEAQGTGLFRQLYQAIEENARQDEVTRLWVHASLNAEPAFLAMGFAIVKEEEVELNGQSFRRFEMEKMLTRVG